MTTVWKSLVWGTALLGLVMIGGLAFLQTEQFRSLARKQLITALNQHLKGHISLERIEGTLWGSLILHQVRLEYQGQTLVHIPRLVARYRLPALLKGRVSHLTLIQPVVQIAQDDQGRLNLLEAVSGTAAESQPGQSSLSIGLENLTVQGGHLSFDLSGRAYQLNNISLDADLASVPTGFEARVRRLTLQTAVQGFPRLSVDAVVAYQNTLSQAIVQLQQLRLTTDHSRVQLSGQLSGPSIPGTSFGLDIKLLLEKIGATDMLWLAPGLPLKHEITGRARFTGRPDDLHASLQLKTAEATVDVQARTDLSRRQPSYQGTVTLAHLDLAQVFDDERVSRVRARIHGTLRGRGVGASVSALETQADLRLERLRLADVELGAVSVQARLADQTVIVNGDLAGAAGQVSWQGSVALTNPPKYALTFTAKPLTLAVVGQDTLNLSGTVHGTGLRLSDMDTRADITLQPSRLGRLSLTRGRLLARISRGRIRVSEATLATPDAQLHLEGELGSALDHNGQLSYSLRVDRLSPWLARVGQEGAGRLTLEGAVTGSLASMRTQGTLRAEAIRLSQLSLATATIDFAADRLGQDQPRASLTVGLRGLHVGLDVQTLSAAVQLSSSNSDRRAHQLQLDLTATQTPEHQHHLRAHFLVQPEQIVAQLQNLSLALPLGTWHLAQPARLRHHAAGITFDRFVLAKHDEPAQQFVLQGRLATTGPQKMRFQLRDVSLEELVDLLPSQPPIRGTVSADIQIAGTAEVPVVAGSVSVNDLHLAGQTHAGLSATVRYQDQKTALGVIFRQDEHHTLHANASLPVSLSWAGGFQIGVLGDLNCSIRSDGLSLVFLNAFSGKALDDIAGTLQLDLQAGGPPTKPLLNGTFTLQDGQVRVKPLGLALRPISLTGSLTPHHIKIDRLRAAAGNGSLRGVGLVELLDYRPLALDLTVEATDWPTIWTHQYRLEIDADLHARGPLGAPQVNGQIEVQRATLRPDLSFLSVQSLERDETIVVQPSLAVPPPSDLPAAQQLDQAEVGREHDLFTSLILQLVVNLGDNTRVKHPNAQIALTGDVALSKKHDEALHIVGPVRIARGWAGFQGRRFILKRGNITFTEAAHMDPELDILGHYTQDDYAIDAVVGGTVNRPTLVLRSDPPLEQADILSVLLFGKPARALGRSEQIDLRQQAVALTSGYAAARIGQSVSEALGLEELGIDLSGLNFSGAHISFEGRLNRKTRISATQNIGTGHGQAVAVDYELSPNIDMRTTASSQGASSADIIWRKRY